MITEQIVAEVKGFLGKDGIEFFKECLEKHGEISPVISTGSIPHPVHFREGMQIRNFMRGTGLCNDWSCHDLDDNWAEVVKRAIS